MTSAKLNGVIFHVPLDVAQTPKSGEVICDHWWAVHPEKGVAFYANSLWNLRAYREPGDEPYTPSPQCNASEFTMRELIRRGKPDHVAALLPAVFTAHAMTELKRVRAMQLVEERQLRNPTSPLTNHERFVASTFADGFVQ